MEGSRTGNTFAFSPCPVVSHPTRWLPRRGWRATLLIIARVAFTEVVHADYSSGGQRLHAYTPVFLHKAFLWPARWAAWEGDIDDIDPDLT